MSTFYDFKAQAIYRLLELYRKGKWPDTPNGVKPHSFHGKIRDWTRIVDLYDVDALKHRHQKVCTPEMKHELVAKVLTGNTYRAVAFEAGVSASQLYNWVCKYQELGYNGLVNKKKGRKSSNPEMSKKSIEPKPLTESEREELIRLRAENEAIKAEIEVVKKQIALRHERWAAQLKAKKQQSSKNSENKDTH